MPGQGEGVPAAYNSKTIHDIEMKFGRIVENYKLINLVKLNWQIPSLLRHNDVITNNFLFYEILLSKSRKVKKRV